MSEKSDTSLAIDIFYIHETSLGETNNLTV